MLSIRTTACASLAGLVMIFVGAAAAPAQEFSQSHMEAAIRASNVTPNIGDFDALLPFVSEQVQNRLIRSRPDLFRDIATVVEEQALSLANRRQDLRNTIASAWAEAFTEAELNQIEAFFGSDLGAKYKEVLPSVGEKVLGASRSWTNEISEELFEASLQAMRDLGHAI